MTPRLLALGPISVAYLRELQRLRFEVDHAERAYLRTLRFTPAELERYQSRITDIERRFERVLVRDVPWRVPDPRGSQ